MIALSEQSWAVLVIVVAAVAYLGWQAWRTLRGGGAGAGCCPTGCPSAGQSGNEPTPQGHSQSFIPLDDLADLARRHSQARKRPEQRA
ncbi:MAG TPA: hypothetical protein PKG54_05045 [Phycisphaerae bacterium]|jgi:hypothetical protein|nr:hypothetical protein [Phycisphaerae bacterium]HOB73873.1 hypothetical protein [Phycisphaerae bacterium]HOJ56648.1 hypothetical protein [Phycisphaerae bacterium]HOL28406.1 hypothetical protein [Phycisphaerae bacterium]HPP22894.1 hypothetical protein [Phycisphaerae bacterium]